MSRGGPRLFEPVEVSQMSRCAECGGDVSGDNWVEVRGYVVHRGSCEKAARDDFGSGAAVPDPPCFVYPDE